MDRYIGRRRYGSGRLLRGAVLALAAMAWLPGPVVAQDDAAVPAPVAGPRKVLMLAPAFTEFQNAVSGLEAIPDWTDAARRNLSDAARDALQATGLQAEALPDLPPDEAAVLHEHVALALTIIAAGVLHRNGEWHKHRADFDRSFGDGLRFLHDRTGADYAVLIGGTQVRQSGGRMAMRWLGTLAAAAGGIIIVPTGGGGEVLTVCLLDLNEGSVAWFGSSEAIDIFGSAGADMRDAAATQAAMKKLFAPYPGIPALAD